MGGLLSVQQEESGGFPAPSGYELLGSVFVITLSGYESATAASLEQPLQLTFLLDASLVGDTSPAALTLTRDGVALPRCNDPVVLTAERDACVKQPEVLDDGDVALTVVTSHASEWSVAKTIRRRVGERLTSPAIRATPNVARAQPAIAPSVAKR